MKKINSAQLEQKRFLLVEDDDDHAKIVTRTLSKELSTHLIDRVSDGAEALEFLNRIGKYKDVETPDIILLDLKLPKKNGVEVLKEIKSDPHLKLIPVLILTTSEHEFDKLHAYQNHVNSYLVKPMDTESFKQLVEDMSFYWRIWNKTPQLLNKSKLESNR